MRRQPRAGPCSEGHILRALLRSEEEEQCRRARRGARTRDGVAASATPGPFNRVEATTPRVRPVRRSAPGSAPPSFRGCAAHPDQSPAPPPASEPPPPPRAAATPAAEEAEEVLRAAGFGVARPLIVFESPGGKEEIDTSDVFEPREADASGSEPREADASPLCTPRAAARRGSRVPTASDACPPPSSASSAASAEHTPARPADLSAVSLPPCTGRRWHLAEDGSWLPTAERDRRSSSAADPAESTLAAHDSSGGSLRRMASALSPRKGPEEVARALMFSPNSAYAQSDTCSDGAKTLPPASPKRKDCGPELRRLTELCQTTLARAAAGATAWAQEREEIVAALRASAVLLDEVERGVQCEPAAPRPPPPPGPPAVAEAGALLRSAAGLGPAVAAAAECMLEAAGRCGGSGVSAVCGAAAEAVDAASAPLPADEDSPGTAELDRAVETIRAEAEQARAAGRLAAAAALRRKSLSVQEGWLAEAASRGPSRREEAAAAAAALSGAALTAVGAARADLAAAREEEAAALPALRCSLAAAKERREELREQCRADAAAASAAADANAARVRRTLADIDSAFAELSELLRARRAVLQCRVEGRLAAAVLAAEADRAVAEGAAALSAASARADGSDGSADAEAAAAQVAAAAHRAATERARAVERECATRRAAADAEADVVWNRYCGDEREWADVISRGIAVQGARLRDAEAAAAEAEEAYDEDGRDSYLQQRRAAEGRLADLQRERADLQSRFESCRSNLLQHFRSPSPAPARSRTSMSPPDRSPGESTAASPRIQDSARLVDVIGSLCDRPAATIERWRRLLQATDMETVADLVRVRSVGSVWEGMLPDQPLLKAELEILASGRQ